MGQGTAAKANTAGKIEDREVGGIGNADFCAGGGCSTFGGGDVGTVFEQRRRQQAWGCWRPWQLRIFAERERRWRNADQHGDGVLKLGALVLGLTCLDLGAAQLRLGLGLIER